jgi:hypothetical protein
MATYNTVKLKSFSDSDVIVELVAASAISPGHIIEMNSNGKVKAHATEGGNVAPIMVALEDELQGNGLDDDYAADDQVQCWIPQRGDELLAILADGEDVNVGDLVESAGGGTVQKYTADTGDSSAATATVYPNQIIGQVLAALNLSGSSASGGAVKIRIV